MKSACALAVLLAVAACADDAATPIDAAVDAIDAVDGPDIDAGPCGADFFLTGAYEDWDSTTATFDGIEFATWTVRGEPARTFTTNPNGRVELCIGAGRESVIDATQGEYVPSIYVARPEVFGSPGLFFFQIKGIKTVRIDPFLQDLGITADPTRGHVLIQQQGTARALALTGGGSPFAVASSDDTAWTAGSTGGLVLFTNVAVGTATLSTSGAIVGATALPVEAGTLTITTIR
ncbi:MAG: hypothetical protein IPL61_29250 [Myxococcales bacterium]|nr:hypothetical protein [Myxococcales bacterium]